MVLASFACSLCICMCLCMRFCPDSDMDSATSEFLRARAEHLITILTHGKCETTGSYYFKLLPFGDFVMNLQKGKVMKWRHFRLDELFTVLPTESSPSSLDQILHCEGLACLCNFSVFYLSSNKIPSLKAHSVSASPHPRNGVLASQHCYTYCPDIQAFSLY